MSYNFDTKLNKGKYEVQIDTAANYGYFEHEEYGDERGGGLWFDTHPTSTPQKKVLNLIDYDGMSYLPKHVIEALREAGHNVDEEFE